VDWLCLPRVDDGSYLGRLLDRERGGSCAVTPADPAAAFSRRYLEGTLVLETEMTVAGGRVRVNDCLTMRPGGARRPDRQLLRVVDGLDGAVDLRVEVAPRFVYGRCGPGSAVPDPPGRRSAATTGWSSRATCRWSPPACTTWWRSFASRLVIGCAQPAPPPPRDPARSRSRAELDRRLAQTVAWWPGWSTTAAGSAATSPACSARPRSSSAHPGDHRSDCGRGHDLATRGALLPPYEHTTGRQLAFPDRYSAIGICAELAATGRRQRP
jgi:hypothetical protein